MRYELIPQKIKIELKKFCGYRLWKKPSNMGLYAIGADVAEGVGGDASCMAVVDCATGMHVCTYWSNMVDMDNFSAEIFKTGSWFNKAAVCIEVNNHGRAVVALLGGAVGSLAYPNLYKRITYNEFTAKKEKTIGFYTGPQTKPRLIENFKSALKSGEFVTQDRELIQELSSFIKDQKTGKMGAKGKAHDDRVMAAALAWEQARIIRANLEATDQDDAPVVEYDKMTGFPIGHGYEY